MMSASISHSLVKTKTRKSAFMSPLALYGKGSSSSSSSSTCAALPSPELEKAELTLRQKRKRGRLFEEKCAVCDSVCHYTTQEMERKECRGCKSVVCGTCYARAEPLEVCPYSYKVFGSCEEEDKCSGKDHTNLHRGVVFLCSNCTDGGIPTTQIGTLAEEQEFVKEFESFVATKFGVDRYDEVKRLFKKKHVTNMDPILYAQRLTTYKDGRIGIVTVLPKTNSRSKERILTQSYDPSEDELDMPPEEYNEADDYDETEPKRRQITKGRKISELVEEEKAEGEEEEEEEEEDEDDEDEDFECKASEGEDGEEEDEEEEEKKGSQVEKSKKVEKKEDVSSELDESLKETGESVSEEERGTPNGKKEKMAQDYIFPLLNLVKAQLEQSELIRVQRENPESEAE